MPTPIPHALHRLRPARGRALLPMLLVALGSAAAAAALSTGPAETTRQATLGRAHTEALARFRAQRHAEAYGRLMRLADAGHAPSAHIALVMLRQGPALFGTEWSASADQQRRWSLLLIRSEREQRPLATDASD